MNFSEIPQYVIQRVNYNFKCFYKTDDLQFYLDLLKELSEEEKVLVHAYALMNKHVHLLVTPRYEDSVSRMVKLLGQRYTHYFNREYCRSGSLWGERFRPCLIDARSYLLACQRYIELAPVRAGLASHPAEYIWSSYSVNALGEYSEFVKPHTVYNALGFNKPQRIESYRQLFQEELALCLADKISLHTKYGYCLGSDEFKHEIATMLGRREVPCNQGESVEKIQIRSQNHGVKLDANTETEYFFLKS
ncbi:MAG: transposase [Gammaproteobacteria bacterium]